jgi:hypothetical protein
MNANGEAMKVVYTVVERSPGKSVWTRVGVGFVNRDGSMNLRLDAIPVNGTLQVRDWEEREVWQKTFGSRGAEAPQAPASTASPASMPRQRQDAGLVSGPGPSHAPRVAPGAPVAPRVTPGGYPPDPQAPNDAAGGLA